MTTNHSHSVPPAAGFGNKKAAPFKKGGGRKKTTKNWKGQPRKSKGGK